MSGDKGSTPLRMPAAFICLAAGLLASGCVSTGVQPPSRSAVSTPRAERALPPDIKQILAAGGLNAEDPSAPAPRPTAIASAGVETEPASDVVEVSASPPTRQVVMAARSPVALDTGPTATAPQAPQPRLAPETLLAAVPREKGIEQGQRIEHHVTSYAPVTIEGGGSSPIRLADINMDRPRASAGRGHQARRSVVRSAPRTMTAERPGSPRVRRF